MDKEQKAKMTTEEKITYAAMKAMCRMDSTVLVLGIMTAIKDGMPDELFQGKNADKSKVVCLLGALGLMQTITAAMQKGEKEKRAKEKATEEKPDSAFSAEDKAKADEILSAFMARNKAHLNTDGKHDIRNDS